MRNTLAKKADEALKLLHIYKNSLKESKEIIIYYEKHDLLDPINNYIKDAYELEVEVNRVLSITQNKSINIGDMPDAINKLNTVIKEIKKRTDCLKKITYM